MKNYIKGFSLFLLLSIFMFTGCDRDADIELDSTTKGKAVTTTTTIGPNDHLCKTTLLIAGQNTIVGEVKIYCTEGTNNYKALYELTQLGCVMTEVQIYAGPEGDIPKNRPGCPKIGHFTYKLDNLNETSVCIDLGELPEEFTVAAHTVVTCSSTVEGGYNTENETAWGYGKNFPGCNSWAMCFDVDCKK